MRLTKETKCAELGYFNRPIFYQILRYLILLSSLAVLQTAVAQANFLNLAVNQATGTVSSPGGLFPVRVTGSTQSTRNDDAVSRVELLDGATVLESTQYQVSFDNQTLEPVNQLQWINQTANLGAGTHVLNVRVTTYKGQITNSDGFSVTVNVSTSGNGATFVSQAVPTVMVAGQRYNIEIKMQNIGASTWIPDGANPYKLGSQNLQDNQIWRVLNRVPISYPVEPGGIATFNFDVVAPTTPGTFNFQWGMVQESVEWFGVFTDNMRVTVVTGSDPLAVLTSPVSGATYSTQNGAATVNFIGTAVPGQGATLVGWTLIDKGAVLESGNSASIDVSKALDVGVHQVELEVTDSNNRIASSTVSVNVVAPNTTVPIFTNLAVTPASGHAEASGTLRVQITGTAQPPDPSSAIQRIEVSEGGTVLSSALYGVLFDPVTNVVTSEPVKINLGASLGVGTHQLVVRAYLNGDMYLHDSGTVFNSSPLTVTVAPPLPPAPTASFITPANGTSYTPNAGRANVPITAIGVPASGAVISQMRLYVDGLQQQTSATTSLSTTLSLGVGDHVLGIEAVDNFGTVGVRNSVGVSVTGTQDQRAFATVTSPPEGSKYTVAGNDLSTVMFTGIAAPSVGATSRSAQLLENGVEFASSTTGYIRGTKALAVGDHAIDLRVVDSAGQVAIATRNVSVVRREADPPYFRYPQNGATYTATGGTASVFVSVNTFATVKELRLYVDGKLTQSNPIAPLETTLSLAPGIHILRTEAVDTYGSTSTIGTNADITVNVVPSGANPPTVSLSAPLDFERYRTLGKQTVTVKGSAGAVYPKTIAKIELIVDGQVFDTKTGVTSYSGTADLAPGNHLLRLLATDSAGVSSTSPFVNVIVTGFNAGDSASAGTIQGQFAKLAPGQPFTATITVLNDGTTTWTETERYRLGTQNPHDNLTFGPGRLYLRTGVSVAPGASATFKFEGIAPSKPGTYNFQWQMVRENVAWFGTPTNNYTIEVGGALGLNATLAATPTNVRLSGTPTQKITFTGIGQDLSSTAPIYSLELLDGNGNPISYIEDDDGNIRSATLVYNYNRLTNPHPTNTQKYSYSLDLPAGVHKFKLRVTKQNYDNTEYIIADSPPVVVNVTNSSLLGTVSGVRTNASGSPELFGWVCQSGNADGLNYQLLLDAPTPQMGGTILKQGVANVSTEPDSAAVGTQCATPGKGHHFVIDLSAYVADLAGRALYVYAETSNASAKITLPCADNNCTMPGTMRVGLTTPLDGKPVPASIPLFMRMQVTNPTGNLDEKGFVVDGNWIPAVDDGTLNAYSASIRLSARPAPYIVSGKVRQGITTIQSAASQVYVVDDSTPTVRLTSPVSGATVGLTAQTLYATVTGQVSKVAFFVDDVELSGSATGNVSYWSQSWTPPSADTYRLYAQAYDLNGLLVASSPLATITASPNGGSGQQPINIDVPQLQNGVAGTLPGQLSVTSSGAANYSIPIAVPPGSAGMRPTLSLDYNSDNTTGSAGLGWSVGGLSNIDRCGKIAAIDGVTSRVKFTNEDRLCLDGQRLILENGSNDDTSYWADGAVYRTEIESFTRIRALGSGVGSRSFKVETKDGLWRWYGLNTYASSAVKDVRTDSTGTGLAHRWRLDRSEDRSSNFINYTYQNFDNGENKPATISWGGNKVAYATVTFGYEDRTDIRRAYVSGSPTFEAKILKTITTSTVDEGGVAVQALKYSLEHKQSPSSGRNLLTQVKVCDKDGACLPATSFQWGEPDPAAAKSFVQLGADRNGPNLEVLGAIYAGNMKYSPMEMVFVGDFNGDGRADILERRGDKRLFLSNADGTAWTETRPLSVASSIEVMEVGDFNGDGKTDLLIADAASAPATNWKVCLYENGTYNCRPVVLAADGINPNDRIHSRLVRDFDGDGRDDLFISSGPYLGTGEVPPRYYCTGYSTDNPNGFVCNKTSRDLLNEDAYADAFTTAGHDTADFDGDGHVDSATLTRCKWLRNADTGKYAWDCGNYTAVNVMGYPSISGSDRFDGGWYQLSLNSPAPPAPPGAAEGVIPQVRSGTLSADLSADGLTDIVFGTSSLNPVSESLGDKHASNFCTSRGDGKADCTVLPALGSQIPFDHLILTLQDFDGDGVPDILRPGVDTWISTNDNFNKYLLCRIGTNGSFQNCETWDGPLFYSLNRQSAMRGSSLENDWDKPHSQFFGDFDGDGRVDIVTYLKGGKWQIFRAAPQAKGGQHLDRMVSVTNGRGNVESIQFANPGDATVYVGDGSGIDGQALPSGWPIKRIANTRPLVSRLERSNGASGSRVTTYEYSGYAVDAQGRGNLGFARVKEHDSLSNIDTSTWYSQQFPSVGMMTDRLAVHGTAELERTRVTMQTFDRAAKPASVAKIVPYVASSVTTKTDLDGTPMGVTTTTYGYDDWVNQSSVMEKTVLGSSPAYVSVTTTSFSNDASRWLLAKPASVSVTKTTDQGAITRTTAYGYDTEKGLLISETREPGNQGHQVKTTYDRATTGASSNPFGLVNKTTIEWYDPVSATQKTRIVSKAYYDSYGRYPRQMLNALGQTESQSYDPRTGAKTSVIGINGLTTIFTVDSFGRTIGETHPDKIETSTVERQCGASCVAGATTLIIKRTLSGGALTSAPVLSHVDSAGHVLRVQTWGFDGTKILTDVDYDSAGREWKVYHPRFEGTDPQLAKQIGYDDLGRAVSVQKPDEGGQTHVWTTKYTGWTTTFSQPAPKGVSVSSLSRTEKRDVWGRLVSATDTKGNSTSYVHDAFGDLTKVTDAKNNVVAVTFDTRGRRTDLRDPDLGWIHYDIDALGQVYRQISPNQRSGYPAGTQPPDDKVTMFTYDDLGRMTQRREPDLVSNWVFDNGTSCSPAGSQSCGQLIQANTVAGSTMDYVRKHTYDTAGRPKATTITLDTGYTSTSEYDDWGRLLRQRHQRTGGAEKVFDYRYNSFGYLERIERGGLILWRATSMDAASRLKVAELGNGTRVERSYSDYAGQVTSSTLIKGAAVQLLAEIYHYDALSNVAQREVYWDIAAANFNEFFDYDELNRLRASTLGSAVSTFTYDEIGNILSKTGVGDYTYPVSGTNSVRPHAVSSIPGSNFDYDDNGNLKSGAGRTVTWMSFDMPRKITKGAESSTFWFGPEHQRVRQARNSDSCGSTSCVYYAGAMEVEVAGGATTLKTYWPNGLGVEIDDATGTQLRWTHLDRQGSVVAISDEAGTVRERLIYDSWGKRRDLTDAGTPDGIDGVTDNKGYTGHEMLDKLDLVHMNGRVYDPLVARFISADPIIQEPEHSQSYNRYTYVWNNPTNLTDPSGFLAQEEWIEKELQSQRDKDPTGSWGVAYSDGGGNGSGSETSAAAQNSADPSGKPKGDASPANSGGYVNAKAAAPTSGAEIGQLNFGEIGTQLYRRALTDFADNNRGEFGYWGWLAEKIDNNVQRPDLSSDEGKSAGAALVGLGILGPTAEGKFVQELKVVSRIKESNLLVREAEVSGRSVQRSLDSLVDSLSKGGNPGLGNKPIGAGISEARARDGARVYFRVVNEQLEILGKSVKDNQQKVINEIHKVFGR